MWGSSRDENLLVVSLPGQWLEAGDIALQVEVVVARIQKALGSFAALATGQGGVETYGGAEHGENGTVRMQAGDGRGALVKASGSENEPGSAARSGESLSGHRGKQRDNIRWGRGTQSRDRLLTDARLDPGTGAAAGRYGRSKPASAGIAGKRPREERGGSTSPKPAHLQPRASTSVRRTLPLTANCYNGVGTQLLKEHGASLAGCASNAKVQQWIDGIVKGPEVASAAHLAQVGDNLHAMISSGQCIVATVVKGFEAGLLACALSEPSPAFCADPGAKAVAQVLGWSGRKLDFDAPLEQQAYTTLWCTEAHIALRTVSSLVQCAAMVDKDKSTMLLEALRTRLHELAVKVHPKGHVPLYDSEAAVLCAALASICRLQGNVQVGTFLHTSSAEAYK